MRTEQAMVPVTVTAIARVAAPRAYAELVNPRRAAEFVNGALFALLDDLGSHPNRPPEVAAADGHGRWLFYADPSARRIHWELTAPIHAAGTLDIHGDSTLCQLWLTVQTGPDDWPASRLRSLAHTVVRRLRDQLERSAPALK